MFREGMLGDVGGREAWVDKIEQPPDTKNYALLYRVSWSIHALELKHVAMNMTKKEKRINNRSISK